MKIYRKLLLVITSAFFVSSSVLYGQIFPCKDDLDSIAQGSQIDCLQGVYQITNDDNPEFENYHITFKYKYLILYLKIGSEKRLLDEFNLGYHGFANQNKITKKTNLSICDLQPDGDTYISIPEENVADNGQISTFYQNEEFYCEAGFVEYFTRQLMFKEQLAFLPFTAYYHIKEQSKEKGRNYLSEFNIPALLKRAKVTAKKAYFYDSQGESARRKAFVVKGDELIIDTIEEEWVKAAYEGKTTTLGWLKRADLNIL